RAASTPPTDSICTVQSGWTSVKRAQRSASKVLVAIEEISFKGVGIAEKESEGLSTSVSKHPCSVVRCWPLSAIWRRHDGHGHLFAHVVSHRLGSALGSRGNN